MKKIEKLELPYDDGKGNFSSGSGEIHILRKVNEIIDVLNSWVFEPTLTIPSQSQKQPEENYKCGTLEVLKNQKLRKELLQKDNQVIKKDLTTEKQEEWENKLHYLLIGYSSSKTYKESKEQWIEIQDYIEQLLSESKEKAKIEVLEKVLEKKTNYEIEREEHGYRVTLEYVLADDIKKEIKLLKERK